jgi:sulfatase maturation enzyme AslB (radical SAM superfamily)
MKVGNDGSFHFCRWGENSPGSASLKTHHPITWFQNSSQQRSLRQNMINGLNNLDCHGCYTMESHNKVSGRQKQLLKTGITLENFDKTLLSSPWLDAFAGSVQGDTNQVPVDWQIDLGNFCNSACVFCVPESSSRLARELYKLKSIDRMPEDNWSQDPAQLEKLLNAISQANSKNKISYLHFIGGEPLIIPAFKMILKEISQPTTLGFTTNLTVWDQDIIELLTPHQVHLGLSLESTGKLNDYVRWGSNIQDVLGNLEKWSRLGQELGWIISLRITPTAFTIQDLDLVYEYAWDKNLVVESCNFIHEPAHLRPSVLPQTFRDQARGKLQNWINSKNIKNTDKIINVRDTNKIQQVLIQDATSYINYLDTAPDETHMLPRLAEYLNLLESSRNNCILDHLPEYADTLRSHGYSK